MISLQRPHSIFLATFPADMRKSFDGLSGLVRNCMNKDPLDGSLFVFFNKRRDRIKILVWDQDGFALYYKRLEQGRFQLMSSQSTMENPTQTVWISPAQLNMLLEGLDTSNIKRRKRYHLTKK